MSMLGKLVAVRYANGRIVKGWTSDFLPLRPFFHVTEAEGKPPTRVRNAELKAIFFIRTSGGNPKHDERKEFELKRTPEREIWVQFKDGEELAGFSSSYASTGPGFFLTPPDPASNMERAYILRAAVAKVLHGVAAQEAAKRYRGRSVKS